MADTDDKPQPSAPWDQNRIEKLGGALIAAANKAGMGLSVVAMDAPHPRVVYITDVGAEILGHPKEVILNAPATSFLAPEARGTRLDGYQERNRREGPARILETTVARADGTQAPIEVSLAQIQMDGQPLVVTFFRDISERRAATLALQQSERRFRLLIERAPDAVWINDGRRLLYVNSATVTMLGYDNAEQVLALSPAAIVHPDDVPMMRERTRQMFESGEPLPAREYRTIRRDGGVILVDVQSMPIDWEGSRALLGIARDVTDRKEIETRLMQSDRLAALGTLLAGIAHEMNNPLAYMLLGLEQAFAGLDTITVRPDGVAKLREVLLDVRQGAERVVAVVRQLRANSRSESEGWGMVDVRRVIQAAMRLAQNEMRHRARLVTSLEEVPAIEGSAQRLEQVCLNLLMNATQALPDGRPDNEIRVVLRADGPDRVAIEISDNGAGIAAEALPRIFDPFFTTKPVGIGMGLGLSICHGIVTAHGGSIDVDTDPARGTTFRVVLPRRGGAAAVSPTIVESITPTPVVRRARRRRLLVVDDEAQLGEMIMRMLEDSCDVDVVTDARHALDKIGASDDAYDVILCDLMMPGMTGMDLHAAVLAQHPGVARRFVFMTGGAFTPRASEFLAQITNRRIEKPFDLGALRALVDGEE